MTENSDLQTWIWKEELTLFFASVFHICFFFFALTGIPDGRSSFCLSRFSRMFFCVSSSDRDSWLMHLVLLLTRLTSRFQLCKGNRRETRGSLSQSKGRQMVTRLNAAWTTGRQFVFRVPSQFLDTDCSERDPWQMSPGLVWGLSSVSRKDPIVFESLWTLQDLSWTTSSIFETSGTSLETLEGPQESVPIFPDCSGSLSGIFLESLQDPRPLWFLSDALWSLSGVTARTRTIRSCVEWDSVHLFFKA